MKKTLLILTVIVLASAALYAKIISPLLVSDCYAKNPGGLCIRVVNMGYCLNSDWQTGWIGTQAKLRGSNGTAYTLWEDSSCSVPLYYR